MARALYLQGEERERMEKYIAENGTKIACEWAARTVAGFAEVGPAKTSRLFDLFRELQERRLNALDFNLNYSSAVSETSYEFTEDVQPAIVVKNTVNVPEPKGFDIEPVRNPQTGRIERLKRVPQQGDKPNS